MMNHQTEEIDLYGNTQLHRAIRSDEDQGLVDKLLKQGLNPNAQNEKGQTPLHLAILSIVQPNPCIQMLLEAKADPNIQDRLGSTPLHSAVSMDLQNVVELLLDHKADPLIKNSLGETPAQLALRMTSSLTQDFLRSKQEQKEFEREFEALPVLTSAPSRSRRM